MLHCHASQQENQSIFITTFFFISLLQISTPTGVISHFVNLQVVVPEAFILGSGELHVDMGSTINLVCIIEKVRAMISIFSWLLAGLSLQNYNTRKHTEKKGKSGRTLTFCHTLWCHSLYVFVSPSRHTVPNQ